MPRRPLPRSLAAITLITALGAALGGVAAAQAPATRRAINNATTALGSVELDERLVKQPIPHGEKDKVSRVLLPSIDNAIARAERGLQGLPAEDQGRPEVKELLARLEAVRAYREALARNVAATDAGAAALDATYRAFRKDVEPFRPALAMFPGGAGSQPRWSGTLGAAQITEALASLAALDALCKQKYAGVTLDERLAFQLAIDPIATCATAAQRQALMTARVRAEVDGEVGRLAAELERSAKALAGDDGMISLTGTIVEGLFEDPAAGRAALAARLSPLYAAAGLEAPADLLAPIEKAVAALVAEVDRLAPTYAFPARTFPAPGVASGLRGILKDGITVVQAAFLYPDVSIAKNALGIPTERYRSGAALLRVPKQRWCVYRGFTVHQTYAGGGNYQTPGSYTLEGRRFQRCK